MTSQLRIASVGLPLLLLACGGGGTITQTMPNTTTCTVTLTPSTGYVTTLFVATVKSSADATTCTYGEDGKGSIPIMCNSTIEATGFQAGGVGDHALIVTAVGSSGTGTCTATFTVLPPGDMAGQPPPPPDMTTTTMPSPDMTGTTMPPPPDMTVMQPPPAPDMTAPPPTSLDLHNVQLFNNPTGVADWPVTTMITDLEFTNNGVHVEFGKKDGAGSWPDVTPPGWDGPLEYTVGFAEFIGGKWYGSAAIQYWRGLDAMGGNVAVDVTSMGQCTQFGNGSNCQVAKNWYYDGRWGNLAGYQPATGEIVGFFVVAGNLRGVMDDGSQSPVKERTNVVLIPFPPASGAKYTF